MRRAAFIAAMGAALVAAGGGAGAPLPIDRPAPEAAIFYYAWYGTPDVDGAWLHWGQGQHAPPQAIGSNYYPARGPYSSSVSSVVRAQMREIAATGIETVIVSWWGPGSVEDSRLRPVRRGARGRGPRRCAPRGAVGRAEPRPASSTALRGLSDLGIRDVYVYDSAPRPRRRTGGLPSQISGRAPRVRAHVAARQGAQRGLPGPLHVRRARVRRQVVRADVCERAAARAGVRALGRPGLRRLPGDGRGAHPQPKRRTVVRPHVAGGRQGEPRRRDDHELQRVARGHADRACAAGQRALRRRTTGRGACRACAPSGPTSTARRTGSTGSAESRPRRSPSRARAVGAARSQ